MLPCEYIIQPVPDGRELSMMIDAASRIFIKSIYIWLLKNAIETANVSYTIIANIVQDVNIHTDHALMLYTHHVT